MKVLVENGKVILEAHELFDNMDADEKNKVVQSLACQDDIIRHVADQLLEGWTEDGYHGLTGGHTASNGALDAARRRIAEGAGQEAATTIRALEDALKREKESCQKWVRAYHNLNDKGMSVYDTERELKEYPK